MSDPMPRSRPRTRKFFDASANLRATVGWDYRRLGDLPGVGRANRYWIAGYRRI